MSYLKPQNPIKLNNDYIYPLTTADQVITGSGERLNSLFKKTIKETATLQVANWSDTKPYTQTITLRESTDDYNVDANVAYSDGDNAALHAAAGCISYIKKNHKEITFYCLKSKPEVNIPVEITGTCRNTIATIVEGVKINFDIKAYASEEELLADTPMENTIGVITDVPINGYKFSATEPEGMVEGEVWIKTGVDSDVAFDIVEGTRVYPLFVKQYIDGAWADKTAMIYQNDEWVKLIIYLFFHGDEFENRTGGWKLIRERNSGSMTNTGEELRITMGGANNGVMACTNNKIDLTNIKTIYFSVSTLSTTAQDGHALILDNAAWAGWTGAAVKKISTAIGEYSVDVSSLSGEYYVAFNFYGSGTHTLGCNEIWME